MKKIFAGIVAIGVLGNAEARGNNYIQQELELVQPEPMCNMEEYKMLESDLENCIMTLREYKSMKNVENKEDSKYKGEYEKLMAKYQALEQFSKDYETQMKRMASQMDEGLKAIEIKDKEISYLNGELKNIDGQWKAKFTQMMGEVDMFKKANQEWNQKYSMMQKENGELKNGMSMFQNSVAELTSELDLSRKEVEEWKVKCSSVKVIKEETKETKVEENEDEVIGDGAPKNDWFLNRFGW